MGCETVIEAAGCTRFPSSAVRDQLVSSLAFAWIGSSRTLEEGRSKLRGSMARGVEDLTEGWLASLAHERRMSGHTLRAYGDDVRRFLGFLVFHRGGPVSLGALRALRPADIRAFLTQRRAE